MASTQDQRARDDISVVCRHLALVAIEGATDEVALTLSPRFRLHLDGIVTDRFGYLGLIEANRAAHATRPPLDLVAARWVDGVVLARLYPRCRARRRVEGGAISELWLSIGCVAARAA